MSMQGPDDLNALDQYRREQRRRGWTLLVMILIASASLGFSIWAAVVGFGG